MANSTKIDRNYKLRIGKPGETDLSQSTNVELEFTTTQDPVQITELREWGGQRINARDARTDSLPWSVKVAETSTGEGITAVLSDSNARPDFLRRFSDFSIDENNSGYAVKASGRISDINLSGVAAYEFRMQDELFLLRQATIWDSSNTTKLIPAEPDGGWPGVVAELDEIRWRILNISSGIMVLSPAGPDNNLPEGIIGQFEEDVSRPISTTGANFENLELQLSGNNHGVVTFGSTLRAGEDPLGKLKKRAANNSTDQAGGVPVDQVMVERLVRGTTIRPNFGEGDHIRGFLHMFGHKPTELTPLHIGNTGVGKDQGQLRKDIFNDVGVRFNTTATNALVNNTDADVTDLRFRITEPATNAYDWLHRNVDQPHGIAELISQTGKIKPVLLRQPSTNQAPSIAHTFTSTNVQNHPTWDHSAQEMVSKVVLNFEMKNRDFGSPPDSGDRMRETNLELTRTDSTAVFGAHTVQIDVGGVGTGQIAREMADIVSDDLFGRFGPGPRRTRVVGMSDASTLAPGQWVDLSVETFPNLNTNQRGGTRTMQVIRREGTPKGPTFELLELGAGSLPPATTKTLELDMATASSAPNHAIDFTVTNLESDVDRWEIRLAATTSKPTSSSEWNLRNIRGNSSNTVTKDGFPFGTTIWGQARAAADGTVKSNWSDTTNVVTNAPPQPSSIVITSTFSGNADYKWGLNSTEYPIQVLLESTVQTTLTAGSEQHTVIGISSTNAGETLTGKVRHVDEFGGIGVGLGDSFVVGSSTAGAANAPNGIDTGPGQGPSGPTSGIPELF